MQEEVETVLFSINGVNLVDLNTGAYQVNYSQVGRQQHAFHADYPSAEVNFWHQVGASRPALEISPEESISLDTLYSGIDC